MSTWVGISPVIGAGSLEGFAVGATVTGAFLLAITAPRRLRRRQAAAGTHSAPGSARSPEAEAFDAGSSGAEVERAQSQPGAQEDVGCTPPTGRAARTARAAGAAGAAGAAYRSRHRLGDPIPDGALPGAAPRDDAQPDTPFPDVAFADAAFPGGVFRPSRRPAARLPRHAAPTVSLGTKVSGRVTGLFAARPLAGGAPS
jgi:hypothetical protein